MRRLRRSLGLRSLMQGRIRKAWSNPPGCFRLRFQIRLGYHNSRCAHTAGRRQVTSGQVGHIYSVAAGRTSRRIVVIQYETRFEHKACAVETVTSFREKDGSWKGLGVLHQMIDATEKTCAVAPSPHFSQQRANPSFKRTSQMAAPLGCHLFQTSGAPIKIFSSATTAFVAGGIFWFLSVKLEGVLAAQSWPPSVVIWSKSSKLQVLYLWQLAVHFVPMFLAVFAVSYGLFRIVGASVTTMLASFSPYIFLTWSIGALDSLFYRFAPSVFVLIAIAQLAFPLGLLVAWWLVRRRRLIRPYPNLTSSLR